MYNNFPFFSSANIHSGHEQKIPATPRERREKETTGEEKLEDPSIVSCTKEQQSFLLLVFNCCIADHIIIKSGVAQSSKKASAVADRVASLVSLGMKFYAKIFWNKAFVKPCYVNIGGTTYSYLPEHKGLILQLGRQIEKFTDDDPHGEITKLLIKLLDSRYSGIPKNLSDMFFDDEGEYLTIPRLNEDNLNIASNPVLDDFYQQAKSLPLANNIELHQFIEEYLIERLLQVIDQFPQVNAEHPVKVKLIDSLMRLKLAISYYYISQGDSRKETDFLLTQMNVLGIKEASIQDNPQLSRGLMRTYLVNQYQNFTNDRLDYLRNSVIKESMSLAQKLDSSINKNAFREMAFLLDSLLDANFDFFRESLFEKQKKSHKFEIKNQLGSLKSHRLPDHHQRFLLFIMNCIIVRQVVAESDLNQSSKNVKLAVSKVEVIARKAMLYYTRTFWSNIQPKLCDVHYHNIKFSYLHNHLQLFLQLGNLIESFTSEDAQGKVAKILIELRRACYSGFPEDLCMIISNEPGSQLKIPEFRVESWSERCNPLLVDFRQLAVKISSANNVNFHKFVEHCLVDFMRQAVSESTAVHAEHPIRLKLGELLNRLDMIIEYHYFSNDNPEQEVNSLVQMRNVGMTRIAAQDSQSLNNLMRAYFAEHYRKFSNNPVRYLINSILKEAWELLEEPYSHANKQAFNDMADVFKIALCSLFDDVYHQNYLNSYQSESEHQPNSANCRMM